MNDADEPKATWVLTDRRDEGGLMWRAVHLTSGGSLVLEGHDLGPEVEGFFGRSEYEFERALAASETARLCQLLGLPSEGELLHAISVRFGSTMELEPFLRECDIEGTFWSRIGD